MAPNIKDIESIVFNPFDSDQFSGDDERNPDINFFDEKNTQEFNCSYFNVDEIKSFLSENDQHENLTALHVNIRSIKRNFENFCDWIGEIKSAFNVLYITETWNSNEDIKDNSTFQISGFNAIPYGRKLSKRGGGVLIYLAKYITYRVRDDLSIPSQFPLQEISIKAKDSHSPWITKGIKKSSKTKQKLYIKYLKVKTVENQYLYKTYSRKFEKIRKKAKKKYYSSLINKHKINLERYGK